MNPQAFITVAKINQTIFSNVGLKITVHNWRGEDLANTLAHNSSSSSFLFFPITRNEFSTMVRRNEDHMAWVIITQKIHFLHTCI